MQKEEHMEFEGLIIDRPLLAIFEDRNGNIIGTANDFSNFSINTSSETKDKTDSIGGLIKRIYTSKSVEVSAESALFTPSIAGMQFGNGVEKASASNKVVMPKIAQFSKAESITLPNIPLEGSVMVYGCTSSGLPDLAKKYTKDTAAGEGVYALSDKTLTLPTDATDIVQVKYDYEAESGFKIVNYADKFPRSCKATFQLLVYEKCDDTLRLAYVVFPNYQMSPDFDWTLDTESTHSFSGIAQIDACSINKSLFYVALSEDDISA